ncbi:hypothetical protein QE152_g32558 [Popillia japonica]|uniref:Uncharacterized protein n=1 Tax=Popillia japonica TaxID=7064 RepID=A0AAW1IYL5_POPJA
MILQDLGPPVLFNDTARSRSPSPSPFSKIHDRRPSSPTLSTTTDKNSLLKRGSLPWSAPLALAISDEKENVNKPLPSITAVASITGIAAASIVLPQSLISKRTAEEEARVVADHYADIVRSYSQKKDKPLGTAVRNYEVDEIELTSSPSPPPLSPQHSKISSIQNTEVPLPSLKEATSQIYNSKMAPPKQITEIKQPPIYNTEPRPYVIGQEDRKSSAFHTDENMKNYSDNSRSRTNSSSSSQRSYSPTKRGRIRTGSPTVLNKDVLAFRIGRDPKPKEEKKEPSRPPSRTRTPSKSPGRRKKSSESPRRWPPVEVSTFSTQTETPPVLQNSQLSIERKKAPKMKEIMTQTSACLDNFIADTAAKISAPFKKLTDEQLKKHAQNTVRTTVDYVTDLAMFVVACWLYLFNNELLAIPVLLVMVYRQLQAEVSKRIPKWLIPKRKKET